MSRKFLRSRIRPGYDSVLMRAVVFASMLAAMAAAPAAYAQGQASTTLAVSVRVIRPPAPRTGMSEPTRLPIARVATTAPVVPIDRAAERDAERRAYRVYTINY